MTAPAMAPGLTPFFEALEELLIATQVFAAQVVQDLVQTFSNRIARKQLQTHLVVEIHCSLA